jgi:hypothetical protein
MAKSAAPTKVPGTVTVASVTVEHEGDQVDVPGGIIAAVFANGQWHILYNVADVPDDDDE